MTSANDEGERVALFALTLHYLGGLEEVDAALEDHIRYLERFYSDGTFLLSGRQVPRVGGFILAVGADRAAIQAVIAQDPFVLKGVAEYSVVEIAPTKATASVQALLAACGVWP